MTKRKMILSSLILVFVFLAAWAFFAKPSSKNEDSIIIVPEIKKNQQ